MKKLITLFFALFMLASCDVAYGQTYQLFSVTTFTALEQVGDKWIPVAPVDLGYNVIRSFNTGSNYFYGVGVSGGVSFNSDGNGAVNLNIPVGAYIGGQPFVGFPTMAAGVAKNLISGNWQIIYNLHFSAITLFKSITPASPRYKSITSNAYGRSDIGFKKEQ